MLLVIDIGNTHTVIGVFKQQRLLDHWRLSTTTSLTEDEVWINVRVLCEHKGFALDDVSGVAIASVVPGLTDIYAMMVQKYLDVKPLIISNDIPIGMKIHYENPGAVGADRLCNAVAAFEKYGGPAIVIDFGTATTFDVISKKGEYLGGVIAPGIETAGAELHRRTAKLPKIELQFPEKIVGTNTTASMQSGIMYGAVDAMEGIVRRILKAMGTGAIIIATGGYAQVVAKETSIFNHIEPHLVLEGARLIHERVAKRIRSRSRRQK